MNIDESKSVLSGIEIKPLLRGALILLVCCSAREMLNASDGHECSPTGASKQSFCFVIDTQKKATQNLRQITLVSGDMVYVQLSRRPMDKCTIQTKAEALPPETGAAGIFSILSKTFAPASFTAAED